MHSETYGSVFALSCEYQLQAGSLASTAITASLAMAVPTTPTQQMRKDRSRARCNLWGAESLKQHFRSRVMDGLVSGGAFNRRAARQRLRHPHMGLIIRSKTSGYHLTLLQAKVTLLAASTLAQMASMAALSSRRRAFFSFALLDFLWEIRAVTNRIKTHTMTSFPALFAITWVSIRALHPDKFKEVFINRLHGFYGLPADRVVPVEPPALLPKLGFCLGTCAAAYCGYCEICSSP